jgi:hypothetical protein
MQRVSSIAYAVTIVSLSALLLACPPSRLPPVAARIQPTRYERIVLGFTPEADVVFVELRDRLEPSVRAHRIGTNDEAALTDLEPTIAAMVNADVASRETIVAELRASSAGARLEALGMTWATVVDGPVKTARGVVTREAEHIRAEADAATRIELATLGTSVLPVADVWLTSADGAMIAVELVYDGEPRVRDLRAFVTGRVDAQLAVLRAEQALERGADDEVMAALVDARRSVQPGDPLLGNIDYVEALREARRGDAAACARALSHAIARDARYRDKATRDDGFDSVRHTPEMTALLARTP